MCIRDRSVEIGDLVGDIIVVGLRTAEISVDLAETSADLFCRITFDLGSKAVSYTHLRAHETDSYLVCRLLLEKKKMPPITYAVKAIAMLGRLTLIQISEPTRLGMM